MTAEEIRIGRRVFTRTTFTVVGAAGAVSLAKADANRVAFSVGVENPFTLGGGQWIAVGYKNTTVINPVVAVNATNQVALAKISDYGQFVQGQLDAWVSAPCTVILVEFILEQGTDLEKP